MTLLIKALFLIAQGFVSYYTMKSFIEFKKTIKFKKNLKFLNFIVMIQKVVSLSNQNSNSPQPSTQGGCTPKLLARHLYVWLFFENHRI